mgnify:FL=1
MTDWQHWAVALIVLLCVWSIVKSIRSFFRRSRKGENPCSGCSCGCSGGCPSAAVKKEMKKKCCG